VRRRVSILLVVVAVPISVGAGFAGGTWAARLGSDEETRSHEAADRPCERAYVTPRIMTPRITTRDGRPRLAARVVARADQPSTLAFPPDGGDRGFLGERTGRVVEFDGHTLGDVVLDFADDTLTRGDGGLLALAFAPDGDWLYVYRTRADNTDVVAAYPLAAGRPDQGRGRTILELDHPPSRQHHGGGLAFGPDGHLYVATGDGGGLGDPGGNAQTLSSPLGKLLRVEPTPAAERPYRIPPGNPFVDSDGARPEIFGYGLRNPYRIDFDEASGELWIADVGQSCWEELNWRPAHAPAGADFEWDRREGTHEFQGGSSPGGVPPVLTFAHDDGWCAIVGGFTYRGDALPSLDGWYLFTDHCRGRLVAVRYRPGQAPALADLGIEVDEPVAVAPGPDGEPFVLSLSGDVARVGVRVAP
jgi:glucose/arabinose dehydrogenase